MEENPKDYDEIFIYRRWVRHWRTGKPIFPKKGKVFRIRLKIKQWRLFPK